MDEARQTLVKVIERGRSQALDRSRGMVSIETTLIDGKVTLAWVV